jgi:uncharacterized spore protein YtfJ
MPEFLQSVAARIGESATVKSVYGEPIVAHGRTIIPVARVCCGFGGGAGKKQTEQREGEGGGGGLMASPVGVFEITEIGTRFVPLHDKRKLAAVGFVCFWLGMLLKSGRR